MTATGRAVASGRPAPDRARRPAYAATTGVCCGPIIAGTSRFPGRNDVPALVVDGGDDIRPRYAVDSLHAALPRAERVILAGAGHLPWVEDPAGFRTAVARFLARPLPGA